MRRSLPTFALGLATAASLIACRDSTGPGRSAIALALALAPTTVTVPQASSNSVVATVTRSGGFTGTVTIALVGAPAGITATVTDLPGAANTSEFNVRVHATSSVALGTYTMMIRASAAGQNDANATLTVQIVPPASFTMAIDPGSVTVNQGASGTAALTFTRTSFTEAIALSAEGLPGGVTATFNPASPTQLSSTVTINASLEATPGSYDVTIRGNGGGAGNRSVPLTVVVLPAPAFTMTVDPTARTISQGASSTHTVTFARTNFTGAVNLSAQNLPAGVTASFDPAAPTGNTSTLTLATTSAVAPGPYTITVRGAAASLTDRTATITLTITTNTTVDFSACTAADKPIWFAMLDGAAGTWARVTSTDDIYRFSLTQPQVAIAFVQAGTGTNTVNVQWMTRDEAIAATLRPCTPVPGPTVNVTGTFANRYAQSFAFFGGQGTLFPSGTTGTFTINNVPVGTFDLFALTEGERGFIRRNVTPTTPGNSVGHVDFQGPDSFDALYDDVGVGNRETGETISGAERYFSGTGAVACTPLPFTPLPYSSFRNEFEVFGVPESRRLATDYHQIRIIGQTVATAPTRRVDESFQNFATRVATPFLLPTVMPTPTVTVTTGSAGYKRLSSTSTAIPAEYNTLATLQYATATPVRTVRLSATSAWRAGNSVTLATPDFTAVTGWMNSWAPGTADAVTFTKELNGSSGGVCTDGARQVNGSMTGTR